MGRPGVSFEAVAAVADELVAQGVQRPSIDAVLQRVGGSKTTVSALMSKWREGRPAVVEQAPQVDAETLAALARNNERIAAHARAELLAELAATKDELRQVQEEGAELQQALEKANQDIEGLTGQWTMARTQSEHRQHEIERLEREAKAMRDELVTLRGALGRAEAQVQMQADEAQRLREQVQAAEAKAESAAAARHAAENGRAVAETKAEASAAALAESKARAERAEARAQELAERLHATDAERAGLASRVESLQREAGAAEAAREAERAAIARAAEAGGKLEQVQLQLNQARAELAKLHEQQKPKQAKQPEGAR